MSANSFGLLLRYTSWGESHGEAIGCVLDGVPAGLTLTTADIQPWLDRRRPGQSRFTSQRQEKDRVRILSGVFENRTTGMPIALMIENTDARHRDYSELREAYRPGHADYTYQRKYGIRDYRGGGRASARETAMRVAAGAVARKILGPKVRIRGALTQVGEKAIDPKRWSWKSAADNPLFCPDSQCVDPWMESIDRIRKQGSSIGARVEIHAQGVPEGLGEPVYGRLDAAISYAMMSIPAVKGVEIGSGFSCVTMRGEEHGDPIRMEGGQPRFLSNHAGGILGGISSGQDIIAAFAVKPTSSILLPMASVTRSGKNVDVSTKGRHDPCLGIRAVPVGEAMMALVLADYWLRRRASQPLPSRGKRP